MVTCWTPCWSGQANHALSTSSTALKSNVCESLAPYDVASNVCLALGGGASGQGGADLPRGQGLTLVHFSAQPKPFWSHPPLSPCLIDWGKIMQPTYPTNVLTLSREVDECKPLPVGAQAVVHRLRHGPGDGTLAVRRFVDRILARLEEEKSLGAAYFDGAAALSAWSVVGPASTCSKYDKVRQIT